MNPFLFSFISTRAKVTGLQRVEKSRLHNFLDTLFSFISTRAKVTGLQRVEKSLLPNFLDTLFLPHFAIHI
jgi:hypothetical protein